MPSAVKTKGYFIIVMIIPVTSSTAVIAPADW